MTVLTTDLKRLGGELRAPAGFADRVLVSAGVGDSYARFDTVLGHVYVAWNRRGISAAMRARSDREFEDWFRREVGRPLAEASAPADMGEKLVDELSGKRRLRFDLRGRTAFEQSVLHKALEIPRGQVRPYSWIAREIGHPAAVRAVGTALAHNPIPYFIPCHRVVRADGVIGNYSGGGPEAKRNILSLEGVRLARLEELARAGYRFEGVRSTMVYCYPTCHHARRALDKNVVWLHDAGEARAAGFRPCKVCRPEAPLSRLRERVRVRAS
jgi:O-6-methylguanine DNA methyltransferase